MDGDFAEFTFVSCPRRKTAPDSFCYVFGYGKDRIFYQREGERAVRLDRGQVREIGASRELLNAKLVLHYEQEGQELALELGYVPSTYYLYDPFLNWLLHLDKDFDLLSAERQNPRPEKLFHQSLPMYNYSLAAYRVGDGFQDYAYRSCLHRHKLFPWKKKLEEWLEIAMERGQIRIHCLDYLTEYTYLPERKELPDR